MSQDKNWISPSRELPSDNQAVSWLRSTGEQTDGVYYRGLWFVGDLNGMYIYYTPTFWRPHEADKS